MPTIENCWFFECTTLSYFTFKDGQETGIEFIVLWCQFVSSGLFTPCHRGEIQKFKKISSDSESNSFANLSRIPDEDIMEEDLEDVEESLTVHKLTSRIVVVTFWLRN